MLLNDGSVKFEARRLFLRISAFKKSVASILLFEISEKSKIEFDERVITQIGISRRKKGIGRRYFGGRRVPPISFTFSWSR